MNVTSQELSFLIEKGNEQALESYGGVEGLSKLLNSSPTEGISDMSSIQERISKYGTNILPDRKIKSYKELILDALGDHTLQILIFCAIFSLFFEVLFASPEEKGTAWIDGFAILIAVAIVSNVQVYSNHQQELQFAAVNRIKSVYNVGVIRRGKLQQLRNTDVLVGDLVAIEPGDKIPADGILVTFDGLKIDQSSIFGESKAVSKNEQDLILISDSLVSEGRGTYLITCVGMESHHGKVFSLINNDIKPTPLQEKLEIVANQIGYLGMVAALLTFFALFIDWIIRIIKSGWKLSSLKEPLGFLVIALTIVVVAVPEGLPLAVTISLAYSMRKMLSDNNFVRQLSACETMGSATVICTDKTGTLTMNEMNAERIIVGTSSYPAIDSIMVTNEWAEYKELVAESIALNTHAVIEEKNVIGSQTEAALLRYASHILKCQYLHLRESNPVIKSHLFSQNRKRMTSVIRYQSGYRVYTKGSPEILLNYITKYYNESGQILSVSQSFKDSLINAIEAECSKSYRVIALAYKDTDELPEICEQAESDLILIGVFCIRDTIRPNTKHAIEQVQRAGIRVIMITGDHLKTAESIALDCGILNNNGSCILGSDLREKSDNELVSLLSRVSVVARSTPMDKHLIVTTLQKMGEIVSVTGDGTNDVPALMAADVGLSMGKTGTELAKEASDIVILDDEFHSIVNTVLWGRSIFKSIQCFLQFQLTANIVTLFISFVSAVFLHDTPFNAVQLLWVNLIMDSLGALALATGRPHKTLLTQSPHKRKSNLLSPFMRYNIGSQSILQIVIIGTLLINPGDRIRRSVHHYTFIFTVFVFCQIMNLVNCRAVKSADTVVFGFKDRLFIAIMIIIFVFQVLMVNVFSGFCSLYPLSFREYSHALSLALLSLAVGYTVRKFTNFV